MRILVTEVSPSDLYDAKCTDRTRRDVDENDNKDGMKKAFGFISADLQSNADKIRSAQMVQN